MCDSFRDWVGMDIEWLGRFWDVLVLRWEVSGLLKGLRSRFPSCGLGGLKKVLNRVENLTPSYT